MHDELFWFIIIYLQELPVWCSDSNSGRAVSYYLERLRQAWRGRDRHDLATVSVAAEADELVSENAKIECGFIYSPQLELVYIYL